MAVVDVTTGVTASLVDTTGVTASLLDTAEVTMVVSLSLAVIIEVAGLTVVVSLINAVETISRKDFIMNHDSGS